MNQTSHDSNPSQSQAAFELGDVATSARKEAGEVDTSKLINNRVAIFCMLFCVTGFLGIPVLCYSQAFSTKEKLVWSVIVTIYTLVLIGITAAIVYWALSVVFGW